MRISIVCTSTLLAFAVLTMLASYGQELPPEIQVDRLLIQAERETAEDDHFSAAYTLQQVLQLYEEHGLEIPLAFWFQQAQALQSAGFHERAIEASTRYVREAGREGEFYRSALTILDAAEVDLEEARRAEARARAAVERAEREAVARATAIAPFIPEMVLVPSGRFRMGCIARIGCIDDEKPVHSVRIASFELSKYEVTFAQWDACTQYGDCPWVSDEGWGRGNRPVINVSWHDAQRYVDWLSRETGEGYRLPSEAEWEYAARAGTESRFWWGETRGRGRANCYNCRSQWDREMTAPVGSFAANPFGLYDVHGNVFEWVRDCWNDSFRGAPADGSAWLSGDCDRRVFRGGSRLAGSRYMRSAFRGRNTAVFRYASVGFRVARTLAP